MPRGQTASPRKVTHSVGVAVGLRADDVVNAAADLIDEHGVADFTIRALGDRLGVSGPTIYWHIGSKAQLLEAVVDRVVGAIAVSSHIEGTWEDRLRQFLRATRDQLLAHPHIVDLMRSVHSRAFERWATEALDIMTTAGFDDDAARAYANVALFQALGWIHTEVGVRRSPYMEPVPGVSRTYRVKPELLASDLPAHVALMTSYDLDRQHDVMANIFVAGVRAELERRIARG